ncbi:MAG TPA: CaiB/BaiF CoA-transferase family protein [Pseudorhodoferax sp.]|nr:CaiB/BaiF CoA-transferase family protein [Pseudorhodoferax sp.]
MDSSTRAAAGPLAGVRIVLVGGIGPGPFAAQQLGDMGADVLKIDRLQDAGRRPGLMARNQRSVVLDLKSADGIATALALCERADALIEGFRPGVMERLGLGPEAVLARNPRLVYGRMTGWGQTGPLAQAAGHDLNYIALGGALQAIGTPEEPVVPLNLAGDFGGGAMFLVAGLLAALLQARSSGHGQVVDCAMSEGSAALLSMFYAMHAGGRWGTRGSNLLDGGAPFYRPYRCADGRWVSIGSLEPAFYALLLRKLDLEGDPDFADQNDRTRWPRMRERLAACFAGRSRADWCALLEGSDVCFAPVLDFDEAPQHPHAQARGSFVEVGGAWQPAPAPRFTGTPNPVPRAAVAIGADTAAALADWGVAPTP